MSAFISNHPLAQGLIRFGDEAIVQENDSLLRAYCAEGYVFHGPGRDLDFEALRSYLASLRSAFTSFKLVREQIIGEGDYLAARSTFSGVFTSVFTQSPIGPMEPHGRSVEWEVIGLFRYDADRRLAEEWIQTDRRGLLQKLGATSA